MNIQALNTSRPTSLQRTPPERAARSLNMEDRLEIAGGFATGLLPGLGILVPALQSISRPSAVDPTRDSGPTTFIGAYFHGMGLASIGCASIGGIPALVLGAGFLLASGATLALAKYEDVKNKPDW